ETPAEQPAPGCGRPDIDARGEASPVVAGIGLARCRAFKLAAVENVHACRVKAPAAGRHEPEDAVAGGERPERGRRRRKIGASRRRGGKGHRRQRSGSDGRAATISEARSSQRRRPRVGGEAHALVPPTVSPSMRKVGWPTPTGTLCPSLPQVPMPVSSSRSLPIMLTRVSASGPLPMMVAPFTGYWMRPFSIQNASLAENTNLPLVMSTWPPPKLVAYRPRCTDATISSFV